uniref:Uncharacterized protein TCIL3000_11_130 n=1 Tax=Trypanosoma congolense (strain IL3000) TaxID=1068625 RepID=G0UZ15_TRYCI|nr:unnamed protein product [Trypanosoma congolense IL3000]
MRRLYRLSARPSLLSMARRTVGTGDDSSVRLGSSIPDVKTPSHVMYAATPSAADSNPFMSILISDIKTLRDRWSRNFRICISGGPAVVVESSLFGEGVWAPLVTLDAAALPGALVRVVDNYLAAVPTKPCGEVPLLDLREKGVEVAHARQVLEEQFPSLRLHIDHSKGADLQGSITHTVSASLQAINSSVMLSEEEKAIKSSFFGESIGLSYSSTVRRAVSEAFRAASLPFPPRSVQHYEGVSELSVYMDIVRGIAGEEAHILSALVGDDQVRVSVQTVSGRVVYSLCGKQEDALSLALSCAERAADAVNGVAAAGARKRIADHPVVLALPPKGLRPKEVLRRLLHHTYGLSEKQILVATVRSNGGTFLTTISAKLCWEGYSNLGVSGEQTDVNGGPSPSSVVVVLSKAAGVNKKAAEGLASIAAIQKCFPRVFEEQLSYHVEVKELMSTTKAKMSDSICPHVSKGLVEQLKWAARNQKKEAVMEQTQLLPNTENEELGIRTVKPLWATQLFLVTAAGDREFVCLAVDQKKTASERKAVASALWKHFREECSDGVQYAMEQGLIDKNGEAVGCDGVCFSAAPACKNDYELVSESDPFMKQLKLVPHQVLDVPPRQSTLSVLRRGVQLYIDLLNERQGDSADSGKKNLHLVESVERMVVDGQFKAQLYTKSLEDDSSEDTVQQNEMHPLGEAFYSNTAISAVYGAMRALFEEGGLIASAAKDDTQTSEIFADTWKRVEQLPVLPSRLPASTPLESVAQGIMSKYGLATEIRTSCSGRVVNIQFYGRSPHPSDGEDAEGITQFFLGHGRGPSLLRAVVSCSQRVFKEHIQAGDPPLSVMSAEPQKSGLVEVFVRRADSVLALCIEDVRRELAENKTISPTASINVRVDVSCSTNGKRYEALLCVVDGSRTVELERTQPNPNLMTSLLRLIESISLEVGRPAVDQGMLSKRLDETRQLDAFRGLIDYLYGLPVIVETSMKENQWYCHISVHLSDNFYYGVGYATDRRKKCAIEEAAAEALHRCFGSVVGLLPSQLPQAHAASVEQYCGYVYQSLIT